MKKKVLALLVVLALVLSAVAVLTACGTKYTVSFWDGTTKLGEVKVADGEKVDPHAGNYYKKTGHTFVGWYEDITYDGAPFDADKTPIKSNMNLFGRWTSDVVEEDHRIWYVMGNQVNKNWDCATELNVNDEWEVVSGYEGAILEQKDGTNEFSISLTMRPGAAYKFRFVTQLEDKNTWAGENRAQSGLANMVGFEYAMGVNPDPDGEQPTSADDHLYAVVKDNNGDAIFEGGKGFDAPAYTWNIQVMPGHDGVYKFTLTTYPGEDESRNTITWELEEPLEALDKTFVPYVTGKLTNWSPEKEGAIQMTPFSGTSVDDAGEGKYYAFLNFESAGDGLEFKILDFSSGAADWLGGDGNGTFGSSYSGNITVDEVGTYILIVDSTDHSYSLEKAAIRVVGTIDGQGWADNSQRADGYKGNMYVMNEVDSGDPDTEKYELVLEITAEHSCEWATNNGHVAEIKIEMCGGEKTAWGCGAGVDGTANIGITAVGWYKVTLVISYTGDNNEVRHTNVTVEPTTDPSASEVE